MNSSWRLVSLLQEDYYTINVVFNEGDSTTYEYKVDEPGIEVGDYVVVFARNQYKVVKVVEVHEKPKLDADVRYQWIVQKINPTHFDWLTERDNKAYELICDAERAEAKRAILNAYQETIGATKYNKLRRLLNSTEE